ncbi:MAG: hypothetical protein H5T93_02375 [Pseudothermotoga sp.]|uniref:Cytosolic protein n=2 Tax=Pseudothermotoga hypogea TaxID=57487 RepID=A0A0X1KS89_9THEM|nr:MULTISPECIES: DUF6485 family protein [Pseudothermotoga]AJC74123.1 hypothetical protein AJ81_07980 [Pseudothermotoga hypogea DSM 11164 = NBRC 106472]MBC7115868.1 hypothetical protein [Pseudothermotoga sp.]MDI6863194.1 DUF6485 family protein [Pseudothermotoga sp.]
MNCVNKEKNLKRCNCSYPGCPRKGICCECLAYHRSSGELPACYFSNDVEKTWDRSIENFVRTRKV